MPRVIVPARLATGATAYHHVGLGNTYAPSPSSPYYLFGSQRRYPFAWHGGAGGVPWSRVAAESRELGAVPHAAPPRTVRVPRGGGTARFFTPWGLVNYRPSSEWISAPSDDWASSSTDGLGIFDLVESGLDFKPTQFLPTPAFNATIMHDPAFVPQLGDWPLDRPAGYEPDDRRGDALGLSDNEQTLLKILAAAGVGYLLWKKFGKRKKNPVRKRYEVHATSRRRGRRCEYAGSFKNKREAKAYADYLREGGHKALVKRASKKR